MHSTETIFWQARTGKMVPTNRVIVYIQEEGCERVDIEGSLMVWWKPQIPCKSFLYPVDNLREAEILIDCLALYDKFQLDNNIKPDYCNVGGLLVFEDNEWMEWCDVDSGEHIGEWIRNKQSNT